MFDREGAIKHANKNLAQAREDQQEMEDRLIDVARLKEKTYLAIESDDIGKKLDALLSNQHDDLANSIKAGSKKIDTIKNSITKLEHLISVISSDDMKMSDLQKLMEDDS